MKNEISGVNVTDEVIERYPENADREDGENVGVELAKEMIAAKEILRTVIIFLSRLTEHICLRELYRKSKIKFM